MLNRYRVFVVVLVKNKGFISGNGGPTGRVIQISKRVTRFVAEPTFCGGGGGGEFKYRKSSNKRQTSNISTPFKLAPPSYPIQRKKALTKW